MRSNRHDRGSFIPGLDENIGRRELHHFEDSGYGLSGVVSKNKLLSGGVAPPVRVLVDHKGKLKPGQESNLQMAKILQEQKVN